MNIRKVKHGTPIHAEPSLCMTCRHATRVRGQADSEEYTICSELPPGHDVITIKVVECSAYDDKRHPSLSMMKKMAWEVRTDTVGKIGFISPEERRKQAGKGERPHRDDEAVYNPLTGEEVYI